MAFIHLHGHSTYSFLEAIGHPGEIIKKAKDLGMQAIGLTDYYGMYGIIDFFSNAKKNDIKPIIGVELGFVLDLENNIKISNIGNICLIVKNDIGYKNLLKLTSFGHMEGLEGKPKVDLNALEKYKEGLIAFCGGINSRIGKSILNNENESKIGDTIKLLKDIFGDDFYFELTAQDNTDMPDSKKINEGLEKISKDFGVKLVVGNNFHYVNEDDKDAWEVAMAIKDNKKIFDEDRRKSKGKFHIMKEDEIKKIMMGNGYDEKFLDKLIKNNNKIADDIDVNIELGQSLFPNYETPEDVKKLREKNKNNLIVKEK